MSYLKYILFAFLLSLIIPSLVFAHPGCTCSPVVREGTRGEESISAASMLNSNSASTVGKYGTSFGLSFQHTHFAPYSGAEAHALHHQDHDVHGKRHEETYTLYAGFGVTSDLDLYVTAPIASKSSIQIHDHTALGRGENSTVFGDMWLVGKYRFWKKWFEGALILGVKFPTGLTSDKDKSGNKFEPEQQAGTGSWDGQFGIAVSQSFLDRISVSSDFIYVMRNRGGQNFEAGDAFKQDLGVAVSLRKLGKQPNASLYLELNNEWVRKDAQFGSKNSDSGGVTTFITPGVSLNITRNLFAYWAMPLPISQNLGGFHEETKYQILSGLSWTV